MAQLALHANGLKCDPAVARMRRLESSGGVRSFNCGMLKIPILAAFFKEAPYFQPDEILGWIGTSTRATSVAWDAYALGTDGYDVTQEQVEVLR